MKLKPLPPKPESDGRQREKELFAAVQKRQEDRAFLQEFDSLLQLPKLSTNNHAVIMRDPNTGVELDEQKAIIRLAGIGSIATGVSQEAFIARMIQFAWISSNHDSSALLTEEKKAELKIMLQQKIKHYFDTDKSERAPLGELALQMLNNARAKLAPRHESVNMEKNGFWKKSGLSTPVGETPSLMVSQRPLLSVFGSPYYVNKATASKSDDAAESPESKKGTILRG